jgi:hypothetical protein
MWWFSKTKQLREENDQLREQLAAQDEAIAILSHALVYVATPPATDEKEMTKPVRLKRRTYQELQNSYEYTHNRPLREAVDKAKYGML